MDRLNPLQHHHPIIVEFASQKDRVHELKLTSAHFRTLMHRYEGLDKEISRIESEIETPGDAYFTDLKKERLFLKDQIAAAINRK